MCPHFTPEYLKPMCISWVLITLNFDTFLPGEIRVKSIDPEDVIERIFSPTGSGILPDSIPLPQMVDILIDFWEADGLFD
jgi:hypothetical protein